MMGNKKEFDKYKRALNEVLNHTPPKLMPSILPDPYRFSLVLKTALPHIKAKKSILDVGCGSGIISLVFKRMGHDVTAINYWSRFSSTNITSSERERSKIEELERERLEVEGVHTEDVDITNSFPFKDDSFDVVLFLEVLEHINGPRKTLREIHRVLKRNGILIITTPNVANLKNRVHLFAGRSNYSDLRLYYNSERFFGHIREYTLSEIEQMLAWEGFKVVTSKFSNCMQLPVVKNFRSNPIEASVMMLYLIPTSLFPRLRYTLCCAAIKSVGGGDDGRISRR